MKKQFSYALICNKFYLEELLSKLKDLKIPYYLELCDDLLYEINFDCDLDNVVETNNNLYAYRFDNEKKQSKSLSLSDINPLLISIGNSHYYDIVEYQYRIYCDEIGFMYIIDALNYLIPEEIEMEVSNGIYSITYKSKNLLYYEESNDHLQIEIMNMESYRCLRKLNIDIVEKLLALKSAA
jgi:hypothetical protein